MYVQYKMCLIIIRFTRGRFATKKVRGENWNGENRVFEEKENWRE